MAEYVELSIGQVALASLLILINAGVSIWLGLRMEKTLLIASVRTVVQLSLLGLILNWIFRIDRWYVVLLIATLMTVIAGMTAAGRSRRSFPGIRFIATSSVMASAWLVTAYVLVFVLQGLEKWYQPQYAIPLLGMVLGNTLNGISVGLSTLSESLLRHRDRVETLLALGATRHEAAGESMREAVRTGMIPIVNSMMIVGLVSLPGMMTGQLVSGMDPAQAVRYQIVIMFLIAGATALGTVLVVYLAMHRLFAPDHRFRYDALSEPPRGRE
ncbi:iron export ABC transporter permease subunit FetB [Roseiconus nitratireducens]|uniref:Iron export ABC transporter permease subunit FetB n=1 Tax=Roseiconus nitratireducens TaxID=2605748 RepID=A0A5M6DLQ5_9BACT|nr:iron export ABC transporter permease subunit FetB [Roseiconus nitratireducens]KAA5547060.1 iron export ABC transporter permease subunit FetB [Roseiconus nitratireducens]